MNPPNLSDLLSFGGVFPPHLWACPIQEGLPVVLNFIFKVLLYLGAAFVIGGINKTILTYFLSFGDEEKAKKAKEALRWTIIGAVIFMLSSVLVITLSRTLVDEDEAQKSPFNSPAFNDIYRGFSNPTFILSKDKSTCQQKQEEEAARQQSESEVPTNETTSGE